MHARPHASNREKKLRLTLLRGAALAAALVVIGFAAGYLVPHQGSERASGERMAVTTRAPVPPAAEPDMPAADVPGAEVPGLTRYPGSVRVEYRREDLDKLVATEAEYLVTAELDATRDFYRESFRGWGWSVADVEFSRGEWVFFLLDGEREAVVELEDRGKLVEIEIELSEPPATISTRAPAPAAS